ncbi:MAG TPA: TlpA disulfide reductase family protein [Rhizomicrobium sp.]
MTFRIDEAPSRRGVLAGLVALAAPLPARAADTADSPIAHGILAQNKLAQAFRPTLDSLPDVTLIGPNGERDISALKGRTLLMPLWAEWCAPCLGEIPDFAKLQKKYGGDKFAIVPILTGTRRQFTPTTLAGVLAVLHADVFEPLMETHFGDKLMRRMARQGNSVAIPCNLLIAPDGRVVGREIGIKLSDDGEKDAERPVEGKKDPALVARAIGGETMSLWGTPAGDEFAAAMAKGFLD